MIRVGWAKEDPIFRRVFTTTVHPRRDRGADALVRRPAADVDLARERRRQPDRPPGGRHRRRAPAITAPTLVLQALGDRSTTFDNAVEVVRVDPGRAARPAGEPQPHPPGRRAGLGGVHRTRYRRSWSPTGERTRRGRRRRRPSRRCRRASSTSSVSRAEGRTNEEIAAAWRLSSRTVERHLSNVYLKLGVTGRAARAAAVARFLRR